MMFIGITVAAPIGSLVANEPASPRELQKARHHHYHELGDAFKAVRDQSRASTPDFAALKQSAQIVNDASIDQGKWFAKGTGPEAGKTRALADIWNKPEEFEAAQKLFADSAPALLAAANAKDIEGVRTNFGAVGKSCKNCHDTFRAPEEHD
jgi:cytochrome c556